MLVNSGTFVYIDRKIYIIFEFCDKLVDSKYIVLKGKLFQMYISVIEV